MGGNALSEGLTERKTAPEYHRILSEITPRLQNFCSRVADVPAYRSKESFGDLDLVISSDLKDEDLEKALQMEFAPKEIVQNGHCWSLDVDRFQIDLIKAEPEDFEITRFYHSYGLNNMIRRTARYVGLKFGHLGLFAMAEVRGEREEILLTKDPSEIYEFLGYDYNRYLEGFETLEDTFSFATSSPYFKKAALEDTNHKGRAQDARRPTYQQFLAWLESSEAGEPKGGEQRVDLTREALEHFGLLEKLEEINARELRKQRAKEKFNGTRVAHMTGLQKHELGRFLTGFKEKWESPEALEAWILKTPQEGIDQMVAKEALAYQTQDMG